VAAAVVVRSDAFAAGGGGVVAAAVVVRSDAFAAAGVLVFPAGSRGGDASRRSHAVKVTRRGGGCGGVGPRTHHAECAAGCTFRVAIRSGALPFGGPGARRSAPPPAAAPSGIGLDLSCLRRFDIGLQAEMT
jgi:hypothetical protein